MSGLDKSERLRNKRAKRRDINFVAPLNPPFPYRVIPFDPEFFKLRQARRGDAPAQTG